METMNIALPAALKAYVEEQVDQGSYGSASEYFHRLLREDHERKARAEIDRKLLEALEALESRPATPWTAEDLVDLKRKLRERYPQLQDEQ